MTRFMMTLDDSVKLVNYAFTNAESGDIFVQQSPAATVEVLALALKKIFQSKVPLKIIGPRHGEKMHETLCSKQDMSKAINANGYYRIPADLRDINYNNTKADHITYEVETEEYSSHNTKLLSEDELIDLLLTLDFVKEKLGSAK